MNQTMVRFADKRLIADLERGRGRAWAHTALRTRSTALRDAMARAVSSGRMDDLRLQHFLTSGSPADASSVVNDHHAAAALATVWAAARLGDTAMRAGHRLFHIVAEQAPQTLTRDQQQIYAQLCFILGEDTELRGAIERLPDIPTVVSEALLTDLLNPSRIGNGAFLEWQDRLSAPFAQVGLAPVKVSPDANSLFDGLYASRPASIDGPLVTVIMPCFQPDESLLTSVRSIVNQTYEHLEVLLVDDGSGPSFHKVFDAAAALDSRIRYVRLANNGGTYQARNAALDLASGDFVTVQDADDWSHPERIARQVQALLSNPLASGSFSDAIRATDSLTHQWIGYSPRRRNASSLMFRLQDIQRTGPFDAVRKSGDSEFYERLTRLVGPTVDTNTPLAITRLRAGTLSRADFSYQWMAPNRLLYRAAYRSWHSTLVSGAEQKPPIGEGTRPFPAPRSMLRGLPGGGLPKDYDVVVILDGSDPRAARDTVELPFAGSLKLAALHMEDPTHARARRPEIDEVLLAAQRRGALDLVTLDDVGTARIVLVMTTGPIEYTYTPEPEMPVDHAVVVARPPTDLRSVQDLSVVSETSHRLFGRRVRWAAATAEDRDIWLADGWDLPIASELIRALHSPTKAETGPQSTALGK